ncbi:MAG: PilZ domain-containing protein [Candidatus Magnetoovum sp. WYHC-5]|nr:PilZ domain-containing protein [Candidatus Magnetoovum sp. WYHC-5]
MKILLPLIPPLPLYVYGEVTRIVKDNDEYDVGVKFIAVDEAIRDEIDSFVAKIIEREY